MLQYFYSHGERGVFYETFALPSPRGEGGSDDSRNRVREYKLKCVSYDLQEIILYETYMLVFWTMYRIFKIIKESNQVHFFRFFD